MEPTDYKCRRCGLQDRAFTRSWAVDRKCLSCYVTGLRNELHAEREHEWALQMLAEAATAAG